MSGDMHSHSSFSFVIPPKYWLVVLTDVSYERPRGLLALRGDMLPVSVPALMCESSLSMSFDACTWSSATGFGLSGDL